MKKFTEEMLTREYWDDNFVDAEQHLKFGFKRLVEDLSSMHKEFTNLKIEALQPHHKYATICDDPDMQSDEVACLFDMLANDYADNIIEEIKKAKEENEELRSLNENAKLDMQ